MRKYQTSSVTVMIKMFVSQYLKTLKLPKNSLQNNMFQTLRILICQIHFKLNLTLKILKMTFTLYLVDQDRNSFLIDLIEIVQEEEGEVQEDDLIYFRKVHLI